MQQISFDGALGLANASAVTGQENVVAPVEQDFEGRDVIGHAAFRRRDDRRVPRHDMIAGENERAAVEREAQMVRRVTRRVNGGQRPIFALDRVAALKRQIGLEIIVDEQLA
jgi:hypothetical protein